MRATRTLTAALLTAATMTALSVAAPATASEPQSTPAAVMTPELHATLETMVHDYQKQHTIVGLAVSVTTPSASGSGRDVTTFTTGTLELDGEERVDTTTQFELGSETKVFTADLLALLVAEGRVSLDDEVQKYAPADIVVPTWGEERKPLTLRDLATHQAGLPDYPENFDLGCGSDKGCQNPRPGYEQMMMWHALQNHKLLWEPGTKWLYSNFGFGLLGMILSDVVTPDVPKKQPPAYQPALEGAFLDALGMSSTMLETPSARLATPYSPENGYAFPWDNTNAFSGAGGLISDADDMGTFVAAHLGYLSTDAPLGVTEMATTLKTQRDISESCSLKPSPNHPPADPASYDCKKVDFQMGLGWQLHADGRNVGVPWAFKDGGTNGSSTETSLAPGLGVGVTTLYNQARSTESQQLATSMLAAIVAEALKPVPTPTPTPAPSPAPAPGPAPSPADSGAAAPSSLAATGQEPAGAGVVGLLAMVLAAGGAALLVGRGRRARR
ncbi:serine hydrolase domain-containing protein [Herbiconiux sp. KACC 21604]|uniref:serine hydrolase domain-containing protein n=1 Tax=unclassified Herbiconiux TaxID=2618217 RepID=UPI00149322AA|nr:serine hydrolase domain-containing protein [Herbiconiux sp. SALV-R1]QJU52203.1 beta-lactamase family protein [Herbiconiux sp. SALV-R1]WPO87046.1 serine hydrolase domain-containing protein [Herbiconiux sp. KACC 21604]